MMKSSQKNQKDMQLAELSSSLEQASNSLFDFTDQMSTLFTDAEIGDQEFVKIRNDVIDQAVIFSELVTPVSTVVINQLCLLMKYFETIKNVNDFVKFAPMIAQKMLKHIDSLKFCEDLHAEMYSEAKNYKIEVDRYLNKKQLDKTQIIKEAEERRKNVQSKQSIKHIPAWVWFIPISGWIIGATVAVENSNKRQHNKKVDEQTRLAIYQEGQVQVITKACVVISDVLEPALKNYIDFLKIIITEISNMQSKLQQNYQTVENYDESMSEMAELAQLDYEMCKNYCSEISKNALQLIAVYKLTGAEIKMLKLRSFESKDSWLSEWYNQKPAEKKSWSLMQKVKSIFSKNQNKMDASVQKAITDGLEIIEHQ